MISDGTLAVSDVLSGVQCPSCGHIPMTRSRRNWHCPVCGQASPKAHQPALHDYQLIYGPEINNRQFRDFLKLDSGSTARYLLQSMQLKSEGKTSQTKYFLNY
ncbi:MAG: hypothetical protein ACE3JK_18495 [Sporolactobacillus sp.]